MHCIAHKAVLRYSLADCLYIIIKYNDMDLALHQQHCTACYSLSDMHGNFTEASIARLQNTVLIAIVCDMADAVMCLNCASLDMRQQSLI